VIQSDTVSERDAAAEARIELPKFSEIEPRPNMSDKKSSEISVNQRPIEGISGRLPAWSQRDKIICRINFEAVSG
jgi:hypothetical protein